MNKSLESMNKVIQAEADIIKAKNTLKTQRKHASNLFKAEHKSIFTFLNIIVVCIILFNFGALTTTMYMVNKPLVEQATAEGKERIYIEANTFATDNFYGVEDAIKEYNLTEEVVEEPKETTSTKQMTKKKTKKTKKKNYKYRITSPDNFRSTEHMEHGTSMLCNKIPKWAVNNSRVVVEKLD